MPSSPSKFSSETTTLSKAISPVSDARHPNLSNFVAEIPGVSLSTTKRLIPLYLSEGSVLAATIK